MIYPARRSVLAAAAIAPLALAVGVALPDLWFGGLALVALLLSLCIADAVLASAAGAPEAAVDSPASVSVGAAFDLTVHLRFEGSAPRSAELALDTDPLVDSGAPLKSFVELQAGAGLAEFAPLTSRRGTVRIDRCWIRWRGPLGLAWRQTQVPIRLVVPVLPDIRPVRERAVQLLRRDSLHGIVAQLQIGEGAEFDALADYRAGMDRRSIDWKQSARHTTLLAKEYRTERNNNIILAIDAGRMMSDPIAGVPRVDRAVSAALLTAYVALKDGDRVALFGFNSHPRLSSGAVSGPRAFGQLQRLAAGLDYSSRETNYTLAVATLAAGLQRRSLVVVFTEFADTVSAELMLGAVGTLLKRHLVLFVVMRDEELEGFVSAEPEAPEDVTRAVTAAGLLRERRLVLTRLRHLGVHVVEAAHDGVGDALVAAYLEFKRRNLL